MKGSCNSITFPPQPPTIQLALRQILTEHKIGFPTLRQPISRVIKAEALGVHTRWHIYTRVREEDWRGNVRINVDGLQFSCMELIGLEGQAVATNAGEDQFLGVRLVFDLADVDGVVEGGVTCEDAVEVAGTSAHVKGESLCCG